MTTFFSKARVLVAGFVAAFGLLAVGCDVDLRSDPNGDTTSSTDPVVTVPASPDTTGAADALKPVTSSADTTSSVLNDDPNCNLVLKYQSHDIPNEGQVHYLSRVLTSDPFGSANPICVQYNDAQLGEVTVWKNPSSTGRRVDVLPGDRVIDKIVVWYN